jgi:predicted Zn-dependent protease
VGKRRRFTLMPLITLAALSAMVTVPALSSMHLYAATPQHYAMVVVRPGDTLWSIASAHTSSSNDVQDTIDRITEVNHLSGVSIAPGQRIRVPQ